MSSIVSSIRFTNIQLAKAIDGFTLIGVPKPDNLNQIIRRTFEAGLHAMNVLDKNPSIEAYEHLSSLTIQCSKNKAPKANSIAAALDKVAPKVLSTVKDRYDLTLADNLFDKDDHVDGIKILQTLNTGAVTLRSNLDSTNNHIARITSEMFFQSRSSYPEEKLIETIYHNTH